MKWVAIATFVLAPMFLLQSAAAQSCASKPKAVLAGAFGFSAQWTGIPRAYAGANATRNAMRG